ncbi:MAG: hypothetical protein J6W30_01375 [Bacteroidales bacterium]|nr:hypothetical protein [Bacteroidales bacterium]
MGIIKYKRAKNDNDEIVNIEEVTPEIRKANKFTCISCGQELSACLGSKNQHHFRHKTEVDCNIETYLHKMGKYTFVKAYTECLAKGKPFIITLKRKVSCVKEGNCQVRHYYGSYPDVCNTYGWEDFDLTQYYDSVAEEQTVGSFVADILLNSSKGYPPILVEIMVSHACEENKKQSGYRIIEIELHKEEDLELIESCQLRQSEPTERDYYLDIDSRNTRRNKEKAPTVKCYNFRGAKKELLNYFKVYQFAIYKNNPSRFSLNETVQCGEKDKLIERHRKENNLLYEILFYNEGLWGAGRFVFGVAKAFERGFNIRNCFLCRYHANNENRFTQEEDKPFFCKLYKKLQTKPQCNSTQAINCDAFVPDKKAYANYLLFSDSYEEITY